MGNTNNHKIILPNKKFDTNKIKNIFPPNVDVETLTKVVKYLRAAINVASNAPTTTKKTNNNNNSNNVLKKCNNPSHNISNTDAEILIPYLLSLPQIQNALCSIQQQDNNN